MENLTINTNVLEAIKGNLNNSLTLKEAIEAVSIDLLPVTYEDALIKAYEDLKEGFYVEDSVWDEENEQYYSIYDFYMFSDEQIQELIQAEKSVTVIELSHNAYFDDINREFSKRDNLKEVLCSIGKDNFMCDSYHNPNCCKITETAVEEILAEKEEVLTEKVLCKVTKNGVEPIGISIVVEPNPYSEFFELEEKFSMNVPKIPKRILDFITI